MKSKIARRPARPVAIRTPAPREDPLDILSTTRRNFYQSLLAAIRSDTGLLTETVQNMIRTYSRTQNSEKGVMQLLDCDVKELKDLILFLLQPPNLASLQLQTVIKTYLTALRIQHQDGIDEEDAGLEYNHRIYKRLQRYVKRHLSLYIPDLPPDQEKTDTDADKLRSDLSKINPTEDVFSVLFDSHIPIEEIKNFLAQNTFQTPAGEYNIKWSITSFMRRHQFDLIKKILNDGGPITDWKSVLPEDYYERYPQSLWSFKTWEEFNEILDKSLKYSMDVSEFIHLYLRSKIQPIVRIDADKRPIDRPEKKAEKTKSQRPPPPRILKLHNYREEIFIQRCRPFIRNLVAVLIRPVSGICDAYLGRPYEDYFFPTDSFFKDLVDCKTEQPRDVLHIHPDKKVRVFHLMADCRILPQTSSDYKKLCRYIETDQSTNTPRVKEFLLHTRLSALSSNDLNSIRQRIRADLSVFLSIIYDEKMDTDRIASIMEEAFFCSEHLNEYLSKAFDIFVQINPRYELSHLFPEIKERFNLFFYRLTEIPPVHIWFPRLGLLSEKQKDQFLNWLEHNRQTFIQEYIFSIIKVNYDFVKVKLSFESVVSKVPASCRSIEYDPQLHLAIMIQHKNEWFSLPTIANAILRHEEITDLPDSLLQTIETYFDLDRLYKGFTAALFDTGFELEEEKKDEIIPKNDFVLPVQSNHDDRHLPDFRQHAFDLLNRLQGY